MFLHRVRLFSLAGFTVWVDISWLIFAVMLVWSLGVGIFPSIAPSLSPATYWWMAVVGTIGLFFSIVFHELSHSLVARHFDMPISGITLFIFGGVAELHREPTSAREEFLMAVAGPIASMLLGTAFLAIVALGGGALPVPMQAVFWYLGYINWMLAIFNLVPAFPLDGGRMLRAALWGWKDDLRWATNIAASAGALFGIALIVWGIFQLLSGNAINGMWLFLIGMFLHGAAGAARQQMLARETFAGRTVALFMNRQPITVSPDLPVRQLIEDFFYRYHHKAFPVVQNGKLLGCVTADRLRQIDRARWESLTVRDVMTRCAPESIVSPSTDALDALMQMQRTGNGWLLVAADGELCGILSLNDMLHVLSLKLELGEADAHPRSSYSQSGPGRRVSRLT
jgi:Zn-dependent protease/CBS domain-containing protein